MVSVARGGVSRRLFSVDDYYQMAAVGILRPDERVELIEGEIIEMAPIGSPHAAGVDRGNRVFSRAVGERAIVRVQNPIRLSLRSEPEPDLALVRPRPDFYATGHPGPDDVLLLVEVSDTTLIYDLRVKAPMYAAAGILELWVVDLPNMRLHVFRDPSGGRYRDASVRERGEVIAPRALPDLEVLVSAIPG